MTQNALLQLIDQEMISRVEVERQICPVLLQLTEPDSGDDFRTEAVGVSILIFKLYGLFHLGSMAGIFCKNYFLLTFEMVKVYDEKKNK